MYKTLLEKKVPTASVPVNKASTSSSLQTKTQTLAECMNRNISYWPTDLSEHTKRQKSLVNMFTETGS